MPWQKLSSERSAALSTDVCILCLLRLGPGPTLFGALAWMLNGDAIVWLENPHRLSTLAWMPAVFLFHELPLRPLPRYLGLALAGITLVLCAAAIGWDLRRHSGDHTLGQRS